MVLAQISTGSNANQCPQTLTQTPPPPAKKSLLDLPAELRNRIYEYVLIQDVYVFSFAYIFVVEPGLIRCNKQIRKEAYSIFWSRSTFHFESISTAEITLRILHRNKVAALRLVRAWVSDDFCFKAPDWLPYVKKNLREIYAKCEGKGMRRNVVKLPLKVKGEEEVCWVSLEEIDDFEVGPRYEVVRKTSSTPQ